MRFLGLLTLFFLITPVVAIIIAATLRARRAVLLTLGLVITLSLLLALTRQLPLPTALVVSLLLFTTTLFWFLLTLLLTKLSRTLAPLISLTLFVILFGGPVTLAPFAHLASKQSHGFYDRSLTVISYAAPMLPVFSAVKNTFPDAISWPEWTIMYRLSDIAQETGLRAVPTYATLIYFVLSVLLLVPLQLLPRRGQKPAAGRRIPPPNH